MIKTAKKYLGIGINKRYELMDYYNLHCFRLVSPNRRYRIQRNDEWCAMFTSVIAHMNGLTREQFPYEVSVFYQYKWAKDKGLFFTKVSMVEPNDLIIYDWNANGTFDHVGFVVSVSGGFIKAIEGNKDSTVSYRTIKADSRVIKGFIKIYAKGKAERESDNERIERLVVEVLSGKHGNGLDRIKSLGNDHYEVQRRINERLSKR